MMDNPLLQPWTAPYGLPPFAEVRAEHFEPAFARALDEHRAELARIAADPAAPTFDNTVAALDRSGRLLAQVDGVFHSLAASATSPELQAVQMRMAPLLASHQSEIAMNASLFARLDALQERRAGLDLTPEQLRTLERYHLDFVRAGARLDAPSQQRLAANVMRQAGLTTRFGQNVLADESAYRLVLRGEADAAGLPAFVRAATRQAAIERGIEDGLLVTLSRSHIVPFLTFSERRDLREAAWRAWTSRGEETNRELAREILALRQEQAGLLGYASYSDYALADTMAGRQSAVRDLLMQVWEPAKARVDEELRALQESARAEGGPEVIEPWDWRYYAEKVRQERYDLDEAVVKPYFPLDRMVEALFDCAGRLFGLVFEARPDLPAYHPDVKVYEVRDSRGAAVGLFLHDNHARANKRSGAWMSEMRRQSHGVLPIVLNNCNFAKGAPGSPTLLSFADATTLFHEFGHGLHGLLSDVTYQRVAGTNVLWDFVEFPSQLFEHWLEDPEVLRRHARHHETGEPIPDALIERLHRARHFNQGYETVRYTASALVDLAAHASTTTEMPDVVDFEREELRRLGAPTVAGVNHRMTHFQHLFAGSGYASQYYVYLWAEVLDADGFEAFREAGDPFDAEVAARLRRHVYSSGNSIEPGAAYRAFRGRDPLVGPMLRQRGLR